LVSVIIPCFNQAHYLSDAIKSVLAQTHTHVELIVIGDGSPDNTTEIAAHYPQVRYLPQQNQGRAQKRNAGFCLDCGRYTFSSRR
jgi:glycosyltransferase involved in cell wall biosynthesis